MPNISSRRGAYASWQASVADCDRMLWERTSDGDDESRVARRPLERGVSNMTMSEDDPAQQTIRGACQIFPVVA
jgi:hypothetical protein